MDKLNADRITVKSSVFLRNGFTATGKVRLLGARIGGNLACNGGTFTPKTGYALICQRAEIRGGVFLGYGKDPKTKQTIPFKTSGPVDFTAAMLGTLIDDPAVWPEPGSLILNGIRIARFGGSAPTSGAARVEWLLRQKKLHLTTDFRPQPWEETIRILREMGHDQDAKIVAIAKQDQLRKSGHYKGLARDIHALWGAVAGYGYRPDKLLLCMAAVWLACALMYFGGAQHGLFAPTSPVIQTNPPIRQQCAPDRWTTCALPDEYTSFSPFYYSLDLILPVIDLQQEKDWAPVVTRNGEKIKAGEGLRWLMWLEIVIGWLGSILLIAIFTNLIKKD